MLIMFVIVLPSHANCGFAGRGLVMRAASVLVVPRFLSRHDRYSVCILSSHVHCS